MRVAFHHRGLGKAFEGGDEDRAAGRRRGFRHLPRQRAATGDDA